MSSLRFTIGGNVTPFVAAMKTVERSARGAADMTANELKRAAKEIEDAMERAAAAGQFTNEYAAGLAVVNTKLTELVAKQDAATASAERLAMARASLSMGRGLKPDIDEVRADALKRKAGKVFNRPTTGSEISGADDNELKNLRARWDSGERSADLRRAIKEKSGSGVNATDIANTRADKSMDVLDFKTRQMASDKADAMASQAWQRKLREGRARRAEEKAEAAAAAADGARNAQLDHLAFKARQMASDKADVIALASAKRRRAEARTKRAEEKAAASLDAQRQAALTQQSANKTTMSGLLMSKTDRQGARVHENLLKAITTHQEAKDSGAAPIVMQAARKGKSDAIKAVVAYNAQFTRGSINKGFSGASSAMFVSVARDTAASLASGANPITVFMQQAPQVGQAMTMMQAKTGGIIQRFGAFMTTRMGAAGAAGGAAVKTGLMASLATMPMLLAGIVLGSVGAIVGAFFIYAHRVKTIVSDLSRSVQMTFFAEKIAPYLRGVNAIAEAHKRIDEAIRSQSEAYDSVIEKSQRELQIIKDQFAFQRKLLELQGATKPDITALDKAERDAEEAHMHAQIPLLKAESEKKLAEAEEFRKANKVRLEDEEAQDAETIEQRKQGAHDYFGSKDSANPGKDSQAEKDLKTIQKLRDLEKERAEEAATAAKYGNTVPTRFMDKMEGIKASGDKAEEIRKGHLAALQGARDYRALGGKRREDLSRYREIEKQGKDAATEAAKLETELPATSARNRTADMNDYILERAEAAKKEESDFQEKLKTQTKTRQAQELSAKIAKAKEAAEFFEAEGNSGVAVRREREKQRGYENQLESLMTPEKSRGTAGRNGALEWERAGGFMGGPQVTMIDLSKETVNQLKIANLKLAALGKSGTRAGRSVTY